MKHAALVLQGGALRSLYTSGVLDFLLEKECFFEYIVGVSAGALVAGNYISKQIGRSAVVNIDFVDDPRYIGVKHLIKEGSIFNFDFLFGDITNEWMPFDQNAFFQSHQSFLIGATNCITGKEDYFQCHNYSSLTKVLTASSSLPLLSKISFLDGIPYLDGGISNAIPFQRAFDDGYDKVVLILTRPMDFSEQPHFFLNLLFRLVYRKYPALVRSLISKHDRYNAQLQLIRELKEQHRIFVICPSQSIDIKRIEKNKVKLRELYLLGKNDAKLFYSDLSDFLS